MLRSRLTYNKVIYEQSAEIASLKAKIERLTKQIVRLKEKTARLEAKQMPAGKRSGLDE